MCYPNSLLCYGIGVLSFNKDLFLIERHSKIKVNITADAAGGYSCAESAQT